MKEFNAEEVRFETVTAIGAIRQSKTYIGYPAYIGLDVHKDTMLLAELGDISRFDSPRQLMAFLGLVPSEHSTGQRRR